MTVIGPVTGLVAPTNAALGYSDHSGVTVSAERARFLRPLAFNNAYEHCAPGSRVRFRTDADTVTLLLAYNNLQAVAGIYNDVMSVYVDGAHYADYDPADLRDVFSYEINLAFGSTAYRTIELIMPYGAGVDFLGVRQHPRFRVLPALPRPATRFLAIGDSITQGFFAVRSRISWPFQLATAKGWQLANMGFGSSGIANHFAGYSVSAIDPDVVTVMIGYNDFAGQTALTTFKGQYSTLLSRLLTDTSANIYVITPTWSASSGAITLAQYRTAIGQVVTDLASSRIGLVDGLSLATNSTASFPDNIHPNDAGSAQIATALAALLTSPS